MPTTATAPAARYLASQPTEQPWVIIPCSGAKLDRPAPAEELYTGSMFALGLKAALSITTPDHVRVLSGLYGLVSLDCTIAPYEQRIDQPGAIPAHEVLCQQMSGTIVALLPKPYLRVVENALDRLTARDIALIGSVPALVNLYAGCRGIGDQRAVLAHLIRQAAR